MKSKTIIVCALLFMLIASMVGLGFSYTASADSWVWAPTPIYDKPIITLLIPRNYITVSNQTTILFNVAMPQTWEASTYTNGPLSLWGTIRNVTCTLDQKQILFDDTVYGRDAKPVTIGSTTIYPAGYPMSINYSCSVNQISVGLHSLTINVAADTFCMNWETVIDGYHYPHNFYQDVSNSGTYTFTVNASTIAITDLSLENKTYATSVLPLTFNINESEMLLTYSLDNQANITINGNSTLSGLTEGTHSLTIYANDAFGNMGKSDAIFFTVTFPTPSPNLTETPNPSPTVPEFPLTSLAIAVLTVTILVAALFVRRKREP